MDKVSQYPKWYEYAEFKKFPLVCRIWLWWCARGPKRESGGTVGGNIGFKLVKIFLNWYPHASTNLLPVYIEHWDLSLVIDLLDFETYQHTIPCVMKGTSEIKIQEMLLKPDSVFIDVGANCGMYTFYASCLIRKNGYIIAVEPNPRLIEVLLSTKNMNGLENVSIIASAVGNSSGEVSFYVPSGSSGVGSTIKSYTSQFSSTKEITVNMKTIDQIMDEEKCKRVDLIKVDVEGGELRVFQGGRSTLLHHKPFLWFEVNPEAQGAVGVDTSSLLGYLGDLGYCSFYDVSSIADGIEKNVKVFNKLTNVLAVHYDRLTEFRSLMPS